MLRDPNAAAGTADKMSNPRLEYSLAPVKNSLVHVTAATIANSRQKRGYARRARGVQRLIRNQCSTVQPRLGDRQNHAAPSRLSLHVRFGRLLAYVFMDRIEGNTTLFKRGYACVLHIPLDGDAGADEFKALETAGKQQADCLRLASTRCSDKVFM